jgi:hypothetical protein
VNPERDGVESKHRAIKPGIKDLEGKIPNSLLVR